MSLLLKYRGLALIFLHLVVFSLVLLLALLIRFDGAIPTREWSAALGLLPILAIIKLVTFLSLDSHRGWCRYNSFADMVLMARAATLGSAGAYAITAFLGIGAAVPRSVFMIDWAGTILALGCLRGGVRLFRESYYPRLALGPIQRVLVVGASDSELALVREIHAQPQLGLRVVGFLDESASERGRVLGGIPMLGTPADILQHADRRKARLVLVPTSEESPRLLRGLVETCSGTDIKVQTIPRFDALMSGRYELRPRDIDLDDLLCREPVRLDNRAVSEYLSGRVVLVTGAAGSIGSELCRQLLAFEPRRLILLDHSENGLFFIERELRERSGGVEIVATVASVTDAARLRVIFEKHRPAVVFHAAAHKHVPMMEANPGEAIKNNILGTQTLVDETVRAKAEAFVMISTDKAVNPTSVMGACKRAAEMYVQALSDKVSTRLMTVRFGNVLGSNGSVVPLFKEQIRRGGPLTITHPEITRYFMTIPEATQLVLQAGALGRQGEIFVLDMGDPIRILDMARDLIRLSGLTENRDIQITFTGLRPGEKLYEELYDAAEIRIPTPHPKVFSAQHRPYPLDWLRHEFEQLPIIVDRGRETVIETLKKLVPEYRPGQDRGDSPAKAARGVAASTRGAFPVAHLAGASKPAIH